MAIDVITIVSTCDIFQLHHAHSFEADSALFAKYVFQTGVIVMPNHSPALFRLDCNFSADIYHFYELCEKRQRRRGAVGWGLKWRFVSAWRLLGDLGMEGGSNGDNQFTSQCLATAPKPFRFKAAVVLLHPAEQSKRDQVHNRDIDLNRLRILKINFKQWQWSGYVQQRMTVIVAPQSFPPRKSATFVPK